MKATTERIFANDIQMMLWQEKNCCRCTKAINTSKATVYKCALQRDMECQQKGLWQINESSVEDELADVAIRLADLAGALGVDFTKMQPCRYYRAFGKFSFTENAFALCKGLSKDAIGIEKRIQFGLDYVFNWAHYNGIDLAAYIEAKMRYNIMRPIRHGKKY